MLKNIQAVIFDLDGTLVDSMWIWKTIDKQYLGQFERELPSDLQQDIEGKSFYETAQYFKERFALEEAVEEIMEIWNEMAYEKYSNEVTLKNNVRQFLAYLKEQHIKIGIATSNSRILTDAVLKRKGVYEYFDAILTGCEVGAGKPAPDVYLNTARRLGIQPEHCLVFEDLTQGILAGKSAGMRVCAVADEYSDYQLEQKKELADYFIEDYGQIFPYEKADIR
ncbi:MAG: HAD family phosphatase [Lachnospiraceae bacterium]